jgi:hypothetical protein
MARSCSGKIIYYKKFSGEMARSCSALGLLKCAPGSINKRKEKDGEAART